MKRRTFLRRTVPVSVLPFFINQIPVHAFGRSALIDQLSRAATDTDRVLVLIQMNGGNDGLNTVLPLNQYANLAKARANILIDEKKALKLTGVDVTALHPAMTGLRSLYNEGKVALVQSVGYPSPSFSHFRATDIWLTASDANQTVNTGWAGRYLMEEYDGFPDNYPNAQMPDPLAIQIGSVLSTVVQGNTVPMGMTLTDPNNFFQLATGTHDTAPNTPAGRALNYVRDIALQTDQYAGVIKKAVAKATNKSALYPAARLNPLADQLKIVAQLVAGGLRTRVYIVNMGGFDTHQGQVAATGGTETGTHATLLGRLSESIAAFQDDLKLLGVEDRVVGMTFSEFGRRVKSNASVGTDHGAAAPLFVFGKGVNGGVYGTNPVIADNVTANDNVPMQFDFRAVYNSILKDWFGASASEQKATLLKDFATLPLFRSGVTATEEPTAATVKLSQNYPNPFEGRTTVPFTTAQGTAARLVVFDNVGQELGTLAEGTFKAGRHEVPFEGYALAPGTYYAMLQYGHQRQSIAMLCRR